MKPHEPLAVYLNDRGKVRYITDSLVNGLLREAAGTTLNLQHNTHELSLWSTHSIRVTAANLLYRQQLSDQYIMTRLRWMSPAFLVYLRNTIHSADAHSRAISIKLSPKDKQQASYRTMDTVEPIVNTCHATGAA